MKQLPETDEVVRSFDRESETFSADVEKFQADLELWQRVAGIDGFIQTVAEEGSTVTIRMMPFSHTPDGKRPRVAFRDAVKEARRLGFEATKTPPVALSAQPAIPSDTPKASESLQTELKALLRGRGGA